LPLDGSGKATPQVETAFDDTDRNVSPDGQWLAYTTNESGTYQVNIRRFPVAAKTTQQWQKPATQGTLDEFTFMDRVN